MTIMKLGFFLKNSGIFSLTTGILLCLLACKSGKTVSKVEQTPRIEATSVPVTQTVISESINTEGEIILGWVFEDPPLFDGKWAEKEFSDYINNNLVLTPQMDGISGRVIVEFFINTDGTVGDAKVLRGIHPLLDAEALRVINSSSSRWTPAKLRGKALRMSIVYPVKFGLTAD